MAATLTEQLYSQNHWTGIDGVQTIWNFSFSGGYILPSHVKAYYVDENGDNQDVILTDDMLIPATAQKFVIYRNTPKDLPLVDFEGGARQTERNLDRIAKQAVFVAAEVLDGTYVLTGRNFDELGFKYMKQDKYDGESVVLIADGGKSHYKDDATAVTVPDTLPRNFLCTIINDSLDSMVVTFADAVGIMQGSGDTAGQDVWTLDPMNTLSIMKVAPGRWFISGSAT
jgi:hypothetical protein